MKDLITKEIQNRADELRKEEAYRLGKMEGYQAGVDEVVEKIRARQKQLSPYIPKNAAKYDDLKTEKERDAWRLWYELDDTIKALQDKK